MILRSLLSLLIFISAHTASSQTKLIQVKPQGSATWGYASLDGTMVIPANLKKVNDFSEGYAPVMNASGKWAFVNAKGEELNVETNDFVTVSIFGFGVKGFENGLAPIISKKLKGVIGTDGKWMHQPEYHYISDFDNGYAAAKIGKQFYILSQSGGRTEVSLPVIDLKKFSEGLAPFRSKTKQFGFLNPEGNEVIDAQFLAVGYFSHGLAWAKAMDKKVGIINKKGEWVVEPQYTAAKEFDNEGFARVKSGTEWRFLTKDGKEISVSGNLSLGDFNSGRAYARKGDFYGFVDTKGEWVIDAKYTKVKDFTEGFAAVRSGDLWGFVDAYGKEVISAQFINVRQFKNGYAAACKTKDAWGIIDTKGNWVLEPNYLRVKDVEVVK